MAQQRPKEAAWDWSAWLGALVGELAELTAGRSGASGTLPGERALSSASEESAAPVSRGSDGTLSFDSLPDELQLAVFTHLGSSGHAEARLVCKKWAAMSRVTTTTLKPRVLRSKRILRSFPCLRELDLSQAGGVTDHKLVGLEQLRSLTSLSLKRAKEVTDAGLAVVARLPELRRLNLARLYNITDTGLRTVLEGCPKIESLSIAYCFRLSDASFERVAALPCIKALSVSRCRNVGDAALSHLPRASSSLQSLKMRDWCLPSERGFSALGALSALTSLSAPLGVDCEQRRTDACVAALAPLAHSLRALQLGLGAGVTSAGVGALAALTALTELDLGQAYSMDDAAARALATSLPHLTSLSLEGADALSDAGLGALASFPRLTALAVADAPRVTDAGLDAVAQRARGLARLRLARCDGVTGVGLGSMPDTLEDVALDHCARLGAGALSALRVLRSLTALSLVGTAMDDAALGGVCALQGLKSLRLCDVPRLRGGALAGVRADVEGDGTAEGGRLGERGGNGGGVKGLQALERLDLSFCGRLDDGALAAAACLPSLTHLNLSLCSRVTDAGLAALGAGVAPLRRLDLAGCEAVTEPAVRALKAALPALAHIERRHSSPQLLQVLLIRQGA